MSRALSYGFSTEMRPAEVFRNQPDSAARSWPPQVGRNTESLRKSSITQTGDVARALGIVNSLRASDGGGSTTAVVDGQVVGVGRRVPTGERPVGDALLVLPR